MYDVHKFMNITLDQNNFFINQVGSAALALGVTDDDVTAIANVLDVTFNTRCPPDLTTSDGVPDFLVGTNPSICTDVTCPIAKNSVNTTCSQVNAPAGAPVRSPVRAPSSTGPTSSATSTTIMAVSKIMMTIFMTTIVAWVGLTE
jgi:hypothetical protein